MASTRMTSRATSSGVAGTHHLELDFGRTKADRRPYPERLGRLGRRVDLPGCRPAGQRRSRAAVPQVRDERGAWRTVIEDMGMPAGKPKTIAVDLKGKWLSASREVRIVTNLCVYWDEVFLSEDATDSDIHLQTRAAADRRTAFPGLLAGGHSPRTEAAGALQLCESDAHIHVEPHAGTLHAIRRCPCANGRCGRQNDRDGLRRRNSAAVQGSSATEAGLDA